TLCSFVHAEDGIRDFHVTGVQTCALPIRLTVRAVGQGGAVPHPARRTSPDERHTTRPSARVLWTWGNRPRCRERTMAFSAAGRRSEERRVGEAWETQGTR